MLAFKNLLHYSRFSKGIIEFALFFFLGKRENGFRNRIERVAIGGEIFNQCPPEGWTSLNFVDIVTVIFLVTINTRRLR